MTTLTAFCARVGIDEEAARQALAARSPRDEAPWYMQAVLGFGAWVTAIAALFFVGVMMVLVFDVEEPNFAVAVVGMIIFVASLRLLHSRPEGAFAAHIAVAFAAAGTLLAAAGIGAPEDSLWLASIATLPFAAAAIWQQRSLLLQFLVVSAALILIMLAVWDDWNDRIGDLPALLIPCGTALLLYPPRRDLRPAGFALLIVPLLAEILADDFIGGGAQWLGWLARALLLATFLLLLAANWRRIVDMRLRLPILTGIAVTTALSLVLSSGASAALVMLALAYTLGSRPLAAIGAAAEAYFIWRFYADLHETLLVKSIILMSAGGAVLICYGLVVVATQSRRAS
ncbi:MAG: DUF4401 domain-containing protein [Dongiaceae bacterium]